MKKNRHEKILELIAKEEIVTQEELAAALKKSGYEVTQATVSRDIRALGLTKVQTESGRQKYALLRTKDDADKYIRVLRDSFVSIDQAQNLLILKTVSGMAMAAGAALDALNFDGIVGCIAGDDTVMAAVRTVEETAVVMEEIRRMLGIE